MQAETVSVQRNRSKQIRSTLSGVFASALFAALTLVGVAPASAASTTEYDHGNLNGDEQYLLELINEMRRDPGQAAKTLAGSDDADMHLAVDYFDWSLDAMVVDMAKRKPIPPLAPNPELQAAAELHRADLAKNNSAKAHTGSNGSSIGERLSDAGFQGGVTQPGAYGEVVYDGTRDPWFTYAGWIVDWGVDSLVHRTTLTDEQARMREIGIDFALGGGQAPFDGIGVADLGTYTLGDVFVTGVVYNDENENARYDIGEGLSGVKVTPSEGDHHAVTGTGGGYAFPVEKGIGTIDVTFSGAGQTPSTMTVKVGQENVKADLPLGAPVCKGKFATIVADPGGGLLMGTSGNDVIIGSAKADIINGLGGNDVICAKDGDDRIDGGSGDDKIWGGSGSDEIQGGGGDDVLRGQKGQDQLDGGDGQDKLYGNGGADSIKGSAGNDRLYGHASGDSLDGGDGDDTLIGHKGNDVVLGGDGDDSLNGSVGDDDLFGGDGIDLCRGQEGDDMAFDCENVSGAKLG